MIGESPIMPFITRWSAPRALVEEPYFQQALPVFSDQWETCPAYSSAEHRFNALF